MSHDVKKNKLLKKIIGLLGYKIVDKKSAQTERLKQILSINDQIFLIFVLSLIFGFTVQQFLLFKGNIAVLIHALEIFNDNKLQNDWTANQTDHLPLFTLFNIFLIKFFSTNILYLIHLILLSLCSFFLFLICKFVYPKLNSSNQILIWFSIFIVIFHENSFFSGVAGQRLIDAGYQPASYGVFFLLGIYFYLIDKNFVSIFFICLAASFHPTYIIHSGFLVSGFLIYYFWEKKLLDVFKLLSIYSLLILPISAFVFLTFLNLDKEVTILGQEILLKRMPHHADIHYWLSYKDFISLAVYLISLITIKNNKKLLIPMAVFGFCSVSISCFQYFYEINSLAFMFPWRSSVFIMPISSMIIVSFLISKIKFVSNKKFFLYIIFFSISIFFGIKSHFIENLNSEFKKKIYLSNEIKKHYNSIESILVPIDIESIRLNSGTPMFINRKHHPFRMDEVIEWNSRINLAKSFYSADNINKQKIIIEEILQLENITHILFKKKQFHPECQNLINDNNFILINISKCYN